jgi:hypothetical protein
MFDILSNQCRLLSLSSRSCRSDAARKYDVVNRPLARQAGYAIVEEATALSEEEIKGLA